MHLLRWIRRVVPWCASALAGPAFAAGVSCGGSGPSTGAGADGAADGTLETGAPTDASAEALVPDGSEALDALGPDAGRDAGPDAPPDAGVGISAGGFHSCFMSGGVAKCWGASFFGDLGNGTHGAVPSPQPTLVIGVTGGVLHGVWHACGLVGTQVSCWGANSDDELGHDQGPELAAGDAGDAAIGIWFSRPSTSVPTPVAAGGLGVTTALALGYEYSCALSSQGTVSCWGADLSGVLGDTPVDGGLVCVGVTGGPCSPVPLQIPTLANIAEVSASEAPTVCALKATDGTVWCWGDNRYGELGQSVADGGALVDPDPHPAPVVVPGLQNVRHIASGATHRCAILSDKTVSCWGSNDTGALGRDPAADPTCASGTCAGAPAVVAGVSNARELGLGEGFSCALRMDDSVVCWGQNGFGQLGHDPATDPDAGPRLSFTPRPVTGLANVAHIASGGGHTCALERNGTVVCWGDNGSGELGAGVDSGSTFVPTVVQGL